jgi:hypothetical protein
MAQIRMMTTPQLRSWGDWLLALLRVRKLTIAASKESNHKAALTRYGPVTNGSGNVGVCSSKQLKVK